MDSTVPPTKANLKAWWNHFTFAQKVKKDSESTKPDHTVSIFGKPLIESLKYASVQISTAGANGELYVWGYVPVVVAKCGLYLKEHATEVPGTFRVSGSNKRMRELQAKFETPPRYGKNIDWNKETYTTHDVASVFRRYLTQMPEPVIPHDMYHLFRDALTKPVYNQDEVIAIYKRLIKQMPRPNQYLLLYVLDLLSVFARKSEKNLMTATNLAVIFRPGLISHPNHELSPGEHALSQQVLEFLIAHQDHFMLDIPPPPTNSPGSPPPVLSDAEDITVVPSSDEELSHVGGGWKLVNRVRPSIARRRTTVDSTESHGKLNEGSMSPVPESPSDSIAPAMKRSRTLPSRRKGGAASDGEDHPRVLRKQKRASVQPASPRNGTTETHRS
ncbi:putative GTPase-activator protein for Rho-like GTPases [Lyophyllum shimeji]|uniref:GTPase-activator protein for Rho-like GTPases n=1 Tax=Lyophyllum shimeji TaxID=47721 RepID=A0A9P3UP53_LYOSH|nr:putative GTPase-activator protein for Rho-like GTPases [Lyophyllum shimeji]